MRTMYKALSEDALLLRRYTENWAAPEDRKVNPWDLNEPNPTDAGTMGTIPGAVIECQVGDSVTVHFRNRDHRAKKALEARTHSLHPHGFVFASMHNGAYPLSPPDPDQPVGGEAALWASLGVSGFKKGDRVPPDATFTYTWNTIGWPATAGVWLYHDHSICDMDNVQPGAIGIVVIHNSVDPDDVIAPPLPGGSAVGSPVQLRSLPFPFEVPALPQDLNDLGPVSSIRTIRIRPPAPPQNTRLRVLPTVTMMMRISTRTKQTLRFRFAAASWCSSSMLTFGYSSVCSCQHSATRPIRLSTCSCSTTSPARACASTGAGT
jgi:hypothetical protein